MTLLAAIRHAPTAWNRQKRLQGRADIPLDAAGQRLAEGWRLPHEIADCRCYVSPLGRARETASALGLAEVTVEPALIEMDFGRYEGLSIADCRERFGAAFRANEERGLDFTPPEGESPRAVQARLRPFLERIAAEGADSLAVAHKGVIRALLAEATGWNMLGKPPHRLDWQSAHLFRLDAAGRPTVARLNLSLGGGER